MGDSEVAGEFFDDVVDGASAEVALEIGVIEAFVEFVVEDFGVGLGAAPGFDGVFHAADYFLAGLGAFDSGGAGFGWVGGDMAGQRDGAADGAGDAVEGDGQVGFGLFGGAFAKLAGDGCALVDEAVKDGAVVGVIVLW